MHLFYTPFFCVNLASVKEPRNHPPRWKGNSFQLEAALGLVAEEEGFEPPVQVLAVQRFSKRVIALWLAGKSLTTKDGVRLPLDGLGTVGSVLG
jgi:hypothetical protein